MNIRLSEKINSLVKEEAEKCTGCKQCMKNCPMLEEYCISPKELLEEINKKHEIDNKIPFSCALCGYCTQVCPEQVDLNSLFYELRMDIVKKNGRVPKNISYRSVKFHQNNSFSKLFTTEIKGIDERQIERVFFPGCSLTAYSPYIVLKVYNYLKRSLPGTGIMLNCCGKPTHSMGDIKSFNKYYSTVQNAFDKYSAEEIIVACQNCYKTIEKNSPKQKVTSLWEIISELGIPEDKVGIGEEIDTIFAIHDPCPTRNNSNIHNAVRKIIEELGLKIKEMKFSREETLCCGSGGMLGVTNRTLAIKQMEKRAEQVEEEHLLSYCEECVESIKRGGKKSIHILDLLFNDDMYIKKVFYQQDTSILRKWSNRYIAKLKVDKLI